MHLSTILGRLFARPARRRSKRPATRARQLQLSSLEDRLVPSGTWSQVDDDAPNDSNSMLLLSDGTVMVNSEGNNASADWRRLTPDEDGSYEDGDWTDMPNMGLTRLFFGSTLLQDGRVMVVGGEYTDNTPGADQDNTGEIFNPATNLWSGIANYPTAQFGDGSLMTLPDGRVLGGDLNSSTFQIYNPGTNSWTASGPMLNGDTSSEESWVKLPDGSILSYTTKGTQPQRGQRYLPGTDQWIDAGAVPVTLHSAGGMNIGPELGPGLLLYTGDVLFVGAGGGAGGVAASNTALYTPPATLMGTGSWVAGPGIPDNLGGFDGPGCVMPNGHVLFAAGDRFNNGTRIYEYDPIANTITEDPGNGDDPDLDDVACFQVRMLMLPNGQVMVSSGTDEIYLFSPDGGPSDAWRPTISSITDNGGGVFTLTGTQLNGLTEGAYYGDDAQMASNYPLVRFENTDGDIVYGRTFNWSSTGVATGSALLSTQFTLPPGQSLGDLVNITVVANGIPSGTIPFHINPKVTAPADQGSAEGESHLFELGSFGDPDGGPWSVDVNWGDGSAHTTFAAGSTGTLENQLHTFAEESAADHTGSNPYTVTVTVTDTTGLSGSAVFHVTVSDPAVIATGGYVVNAVEGADSGSQTVATFTDPGGAEATGDYTATIDWGDGTPTTLGTITFGGVLGSKTDSFIVSGNHTYAEESEDDHPGSNPYQITVTISHEAAPTDVAHSTAVVSDPAVIATGGFQFVAVEGDPSAVQTVATFTDPGGAEALSDYGALIDWGDGTAPSAGTISFAGGVFTVKGSHTYAIGLGEPGDFGNTFCDADPPSYHKKITVTISHENAPTAQAVSDAKISIKPGTAHLTNLGSLIVVGTPANDSIVFNNVGGKTRTVTVQLGSTVLGTFTVSAAGRIVVAAMGGDDSTQVAGGIVVQTVQYGGPGNDRLKGGGGKNILVGCEGDDTLTSGNLGDLMVGGAGADRLVGGNGNDILVSALLVDGANNEDDGYTDLVNILILGTIPAPLHVMDDGAVDKLTGSSGTDTAYYNFAGGGVLDIATDGLEIKIDI